MKIGHPKNFWGGVMFAVIGLIFAVIARGVPGLAFIPGYTMGTPARMGPGFFPFYLGMIMLILGIIIAVNGIRTDGGKEGQLEKFHWGPVLWVLGAIVIFGLLLKPVLILAVCLTIFCALVFVVGLKLPIPLCPDIESLQSAVGMCRA